MKTELSKYNTLNGFKNKCKHTLCSEQIGELKAFCQFNDDDNDENNSHQDELPNEVIINSRGQYLLGTVPLSQISYDEYTDRTLSCWKMRR